MPGRLVSREHWQRGQCVHWWWSMVSCLASPRMMLRWLVCWEPCQLCMCHWRSGIETSKHLTHD